MTSRSRASALGAVTVVAVLGLGAVARASPASWSSDAGRSRLVIHVLKKGLLSGLAHDHHFLATDWRASARFDAPAAAPASFEVVVRAASLRDQQPALSAEERGRVDRQAAGILDAARFPEIRFESDLPLRGPAAGAAPDGPLDGELRGELTLHGVRRPLTLPLQAVREGDGWRVHGTVRFRQHDFGIEPYSAFLGTVAVHDEVEVEFDLRLSPDA